jgi:NADH dehydrogenase (ubiquinone) Fe-S protein 3
MLTKFNFQFQKQIPFLAFQRFDDEICLILTHDKLLFSLKVLKQNILSQFNILSCISGVDLLQKQYRFIVVYDLLTLVYNTRLRIKVYLNEYDFIPSLINIYINSNWWEREIWDLYGIFFENHIDLRRILNDYTFEGFPMRKDYPLSGFGETRYDLNTKRTVIEMLQFSQEYRTYSF